MSGVTCDRAWLFTPIEPFCKKTHGELRFPNSLPGVSCKACGNSWFAPSSVANELPESLRNEPHFMHANVPWQRYQELLKQVLIATGQDVGHQLLPGTSFHPAQWRLPKSMEYDWYSPAGGEVVSARLASELQYGNLHGVDFGRLFVRHPNSNNTYWKSFVSRRLDNPWIEAGLYYEVCSVCGLTECDRPSVGRFKSKCKRLKIIPRSFIPYDVLGEQGFNGVLVSDKAYRIMSGFNMGLYRCTPYRLVDDF